MRRLHKFAMKLVLYFLLFMFLCATVARVQHCASDQNYWKYLRSGQFKCSVARGSKSKLNVHKHAFARVECTRKCIGCLSCLFCPFEKSTPHVKSSQFFSTFTTKKCIEGKRNIANYIIGQRKANYFSLMKIFFVSCPIRCGFQCFPANVLVAPRATLCACSRRIKLYNCCLNHFFVRLAFCFYLRNTKKRERNKKRKIPEQKIFDVSGGNVVM